MKLTDWYSGDQKPVYVGVYQREYEDGETVERYCYWDGKLFSAAFLTMGQAYEFAGCTSISLAQDLPWRGVCK
jgi:hypothetical protein